MGTIAPVESGETPEQHATAPYCTVKQLQSRLGGPDCISKMTIYRLIHEGELDAIQVSPQKILILCASVDAWLKRSKMASPNSATPAPALLPQVLGSRADGEGVA